MAELDRRTFFHIGLGAACAGAARAVPCTGRPALAEIATALTDASRAGAFDAAVGLIERGATWQDLLGGTFLAGVREVKPRPVGFKFHCVMVVESAFQLADGALPADRLLPVLYTIDDFKSAQRRDEQLGDWKLPERKDTSSLTRRAATDAFAGAMRDWNDEDADRAVASLYASTPMDELFELVWPLAARSFHNIGHNVIYAAHAFRTLKRIGWEHGAPVMRSLVHGILDGGKDADTRAFDINRKLVAEAPDGWRRGRVDPDVSGRLLEKLRSVARADVGALVLEQLAAGHAPSSLWDGARLLAAELMIRKPGIIALHATTSLNAMHFAYRTAKRDDTKLLALMQGASWAVQFRDEVERRYAVGMKKSALARIDRRSTAVDATVAQVFREAGRDRDAAGSLVVSCAGHEPWREKLMAGIRRQVFTKAREHHMYKYPAAVLEDQRFVHERWRPHYLGAALSYLPSARTSDSRVYERSRAAIQKLS